MHVRADQLDQSRGDFERLWNRHLVGSEVFQHKLPNPMRGQLPNESNRVRENDFRRGRDCLTTFPSPSTRMKLSAMINYLARSSGERRDETARYTRRIVRGNFNERLRARIPFKSTENRS